MSLYKVSMREAKQHIIDCFEAGLVPQILGSPGIGKSSIMKAIANEYDLELIDVRLATMEVVDLNGFPDLRGDKATYLPFDVFPTTKDSIPKGKDGWILFLDELALAPKEVQRGAYKLILDRMVGQHELHDSVYIAAASNLITDRAMVNPLSTALESRLVDIEVEVKFDEWLEDIAMKQRFDSRIISYLSYAPSKLMTFDPQSTDKKYCCPRTWQFMNKLIKDKPIDKKKLSLFAGVISPGVAADFLSFTELFNELPSYESIKENPEAILVPDGANKRYATIVHITDHIKKEDISQVFKYVSKFTADFRALFFKILVFKDKSYLQNEIFVNNMQEFAKYVF